MREDFLVARVIARPFTGKNGKFKLNNAGRKDYSISPPKKTILDDLNEKGYNVIGIVKINDIFAEQGINKALKATNNQEALNKLSSIMDKNFTGLCMVNLADFDNLYGHLRDLEGYGKALEDLDVEMLSLIHI